MTRFNSLFRTSSDHSLKTLTNKISLVSSLLCTKNTLSNPPLFEQCIAVSAQGSPPREPRDFILPAKAKALHFFITTTFGIQPNRTAYPFTNGALDVLRIARLFGSVIYSQLLNYKARLTPNNNCQF